MTQAFYSIFELQGRGTFLLHTLIWNILRVELTVRCYKRQLDRLSKSINRVITTLISYSCVDAEEQEKETRQLDQRCALRNKNNIDPIRYLSASDTTYATYDRVWQTEERVQ